MRGENIRPKDSTTEHTEDNFKFKNTVFSMVKFDNTKK